jgi:outer membrane protein TolC
MSVASRVCRGALALLTALLIQPSATSAEEGVQELSLSVAIAEALARSPTAGIERGRVDEAEADYRAARAGLLPRLSASAYYNRLDPDRLSPGGGAVTAGPLFAREGFAGLVARQLLYDGRTRAVRDAARDAVASQRAGLASSQADVVYQVTQSYYRVLEARALIRAAEDAAARAREFETLTAVLFEAGKVTRLDLLKARSGRLDGEAASTRARELETAANALLAAAIGREAPDFRVDGVLPGALEPPPPEPAALAAALVGNPDLERLRRQVAQAERSAVAARGARHPTLSLQGGYAYRDRDIVGGADEWTAGVFLELPLFDGGAIAAGAAKATAALDQRREAERAARLDLASQLRQALSAWRTALADAESAAQRIATNRESASAAEALYGAGKATALDVLAAQADLARAESDRAQALAAYAVARAATDRLAGASPAQAAGERP